MVNSNQTGQTWAQWASMPPVAGQNFYPVQQLAAVTAVTVVASGMQLSVASAQWASMVPAAGQNFYPVMQSAAVVALSLVVALLELNLMAETAEVRRTVLNISVKFLFCLIIRSI